MRIRGTVCFLIIDLDRALVGSAVAQQACSQGLTDCSTRCFGFRLVLKSLDDLLLFSVFLWSPATTKTFRLTGTELKRLSKQITFISDGKQGLSSPKGSNSPFNTTSRRLFHIESRRRVRAEISALWERSLSSSITKVFPGCTR